MPVSATYHSEHGWFEHHCTGLTTARDIAGAIEQSVLSENWGGGKHRLIRITPETDLSELTLEAIQTDIVPKIETLRHLIPEQQKAAIVATGYGHDVIGQLYQHTPVNKDVFEYRVFTTEDEAVASLRN